MKFETIELNENSIERFNQVENAVNTVVRNYDKIMGKLHLGGRKGQYDDDKYEFVGGAKDELRKKHYDKSLRFLWKAQEHASWSSFRDSTKDELALMEMAEKSLSKDEKKERQRINSQEYRDLLNKTYTAEQKQSIVNVLALIGHGEAYAWLVSTEVLNEVKSTGGRTALTMQVLEEAKHFVVLRELLQAFECEIPRLSAWEYVLLERSFKSKGLEKFFAMNVLIEGFALSLFGMMSILPGLEILRLFHLDESRHTALPSNYFKEFPMSSWQMGSPLRRIHRLSLVLPALPLMMQVQPDLAKLGIDSFEFGGSSCRKIIHLSARVGFKLPITSTALAKLLNYIFNRYCKYSRPGHKWQDYMQAETTKGRPELKIEKEVFELESNSQEQAEMLKIAS